MARELALNSMMGRCWREFLLPLYVGLGLGALLKVDPAMEDSALTVEYLADHLWLVGSPNTVIGKINALQTGTGGFGYLVIVCYDSADEPAPWERNLDLLINEVQPALSVRNLEALS